MDARDFGLSTAGSVFARRRPWSTQCPVDSSLSPGFSAASPRHSASRCVGVGARVCVNVRLALTSGFHVSFFLEENATSRGRNDGFKRIHGFVSVVAADACRCVAARGGLFGMQGGALETFDAFLREVSIRVPETWTRGAPLNAWKHPEDYYDIMTLWY